MKCVIRLGVLLGLSVAAGMSLAATAYDFTPDPAEYAICNARGSGGNSATDVSRWDWPGGETPAAMREDVKYYSAKGGFFNLSANTVTRFPGTELVLDGSGGSYPWGSSEILLAGATSGTLLMTNAIAYGNTHFTSWNTSIGNISGRMEVRSRAGWPVRFGLKSALNSSVCYMTLKELTLIGGTANPIEFHTSPSHAVTNKYGKMTVYLKDCDFTRFHGTNRVYVSTTTDPTTLPVDRTVARTILRPNDMTMNGTLILEDCSILSLADVTQELVVSNLVLMGGAKIEGLAAGKTIRVMGSLETDCTDDKRIEVDLSSFVDPGDGNDAATLFTFGPNATHEGFDESHLNYTNLTRGNVSFLDFMTTGWKHGNLVLTATKDFIWLVNSVRGTNPVETLSDWNRPIGTELTAHDPAATYMIQNKRAYLQVGSDDLIFPGARQIMMSSAADELMVSVSRNVYFPDLHLVGYAGFKTWDGGITKGISGQVTVHTIDPDKAAFVNLDYTLVGRTEYGNVALLTNLTLKGAADAVFNICGPAGANSHGDAQTSVVLRDCDFSAYLGQLRFYLPPAKANDYDRATARMIVKPDDMAFGGRVLFKDSALLALDDVTTEVAFGGLTLGSNSYIRAAHPAKTIRIAGKLATEPMGDVKVEVDVSNLWGQSGKPPIDLFTCTKTADVTEFDAASLVYLRNGESAGDRVEAKWVETETARIFRVSRVQKGLVFTVK